jgi:MoxR-like ATPase
MSVHDAVLGLKARMGESIIGRESMIERLLLGLLANGNLLVEDDARRGVDASWRQ